MVESKVELKDFWLENRKVVMKAVQMATNKAVKKVERKVK
jgi:hypothetical protein